ncbi:transposase [Saccharopolyspora pogona]|uniref:transposase n=1 Tax=Saccharopolyspora pogona TaxID=333966 RepID=UPI001686F3A3
MAAPKKYPDELRERAVRLYRKSNLIRRLAAQLGVHPEALRNWIRQDEADRGDRGDRPTTSEVEELRRLRKENAELRPAPRVWDQCRGTQAARCTGSTPRRRVALRRNSDQTLSPIPIRAWVCWARSAAALAP